MREREKTRLVTKLEDLRDIRTRLERFSRVWNQRVNARAFAELEAMIRYKAERAGVEVVGAGVVDEVAQGRLF